MYFYTDIHHSISHNRHEVESTQVPCDGKEILADAATWMTLEEILLSVINELQKKMNTV